MARFAYKNSLGAGWSLSFLDNEGSGSTPGFLGVLYHANTAERTYTFPDKSGTIPTTADVTDKVMTTLGDLIIGGSSGAASRLAGNISTTPAVLMQTGTGAASAAPAWATLFTGTPSMDGTASPGTGTALALGNHTHPTDTWILSYIQSRGENLITNGTGLLKTNKNFTSFTFDGSDAYYTTGAFKNSTYNAVVTSDELIPVDVTKTYRLTVAAKTSPHVTGAHSYIGLSHYDADGLPITATYRMYQANTLTTLAADLKPGDTTITLTDATNWNNAAGSATYKRGIIVWNYVNSLGYAFPALTYSRNAWLNLYADGGISGNVITLTTAWTGPTIPAGTQLSNSDSGGTYAYITNCNNTDIPAEWTIYTGTIGGLDTTGTCVYTKFPHGTAYTRVLFLLNRDVAGSTTWVSNLVFGVDNAAYAQVTYVGTTAIALNRASAAQSLTGITSIDGSAAKLTTARKINGVNFDGSADITVPLNSTDDASTSSAVYLTWTASTGGNASAKTSSSKLSFVPSTGTLSATAFSGSGANLTSIPNGALSNSSITLGTTGISLGGSTTALAGLTTLGFTSAGYISMPNGAQRGVQFSYGSLGSLYSSLGTMLGSNVYVNPADTVSRQVRIKNTHATYGYAYYKQEEGTHTWYGAAGSVTADAIVSPTTQMTLSSTGLTVTGAIVKSGGTSSQFLKADGSVDASVYLVSGGVLGTPSSGNLTNCSFPTLNQSTTGSAGYLKVADTRTDVTTPESLNSPLFHTDFKQNTVEGLSDGGTYFGEMTFRPYGSSTDWSGGPAHQLGFTQNGNVYHRKGTSTTWGSWYKFWDSGNLDPTSYQPVSTILSSLSGLASSAGWLHNDGAGALAYTTPTAAQVGADASGTASSAVSTHAALRTGIHGITIASGKTFTCNNTLTLSGTDGSTLNVGAGGTLGTGAYAAAYILPVATASVLGGVKPDGTTILNSSGVLSATPASIGALAVGATAADSSKLGGTAAASYALAANLPVASSATPLMNGTAAAGTAAPYAREDHVHGTDTSRQAALSGTGFVKISGTTISYDASTYVQTTTDESIAGIKTFSDTTDSTTTTSGGALFSGGIGVAKNATMASAYVTGSLGVGTAASGTAGEIRATGNVTAYYSSDRRLKRNIRPITSALDKVERLSGVTFDWTEDYIRTHGGVDGRFVRRRNVGLIAQEVQEVLPEVVTQRDDGYLALRYDQVVALLVEAIKEQQKQIEILGVRG